MEQTFFKLKVVTTLPFLRVIICNGYHTEVCNKTIQGVLMPYFSTTGAGDCFVGAFVKKLSEGGKSLLDHVLVMYCKLQDAVRYANCLYFNTDK